MLNIGKHDPLGGSVRKAIHEWQEWQGHALRLARTCMTNPPRPLNGESKLSRLMQPQKKLGEPS